MQGGHPDAVNFFRPNQPTHGPVDREASFWFCRHLSVACCACSSHQAGRGLLAVASA